MKPKITVFNFNDFVKVRLESQVNSINEIELSIHGQTLNIKREDDKDCKIKEECYVKTERGNDWFNISVPLPVKVTHSKIRILYVNGFLEIKFAKIVIGK